MPSELLSAARRALGEYLRVRPGESVLVVHDGSVPAIAAALSKAACELRIPLTVREIESTGGHGREPDDDTAAAMRGHPVVLCPTRFSLTHTRATRAAVAAGSRVATLPGIDEALFSAGLAIAPEELHAAGEFWLAQLAQAREIRIHTATGTDLTFTRGTYPLFNDDGCLDRPGVYGNLPAGEVFLAPDPGSAHGTIILDGTIGGQPWQADSPPATVTVQDGRAIAFSGIRGERLRSTLLTAGEDGLILAEFGIGTHPALTLTGKLLGDEKLKGTIHLAFGNNRSMGGDNDVPVHIDGLVLAPDVEFDGRPVIHGGTWLPGKA
jgi:leucyl aminopeptidase (aminopeptidase T)